MNEGGVNERDKGVYFEIDPDNLFSEMKFQRGASPEKLEQLVGRPKTDEENQESKKKRLSSQLTINSVKNVKTNLD